MVFPNNNIVWMVGICNDYYEMQKCRARLYYDGQLGALPSLRDSTPKVLQYAWMNESIKEDAVHVQVTNKIL